MFYRVFFAMQELNLKRYTSMPLKNLYKAYVIAVREGRAPDLITAMRIDAERLEARVAARWAQCRINEWNELPLRGGRRKGAPP